jgi:hypothetical protein
VEETSVQGPLNLYPLNSGGQALGRKPPGKDQKLPGHVGSREVP